MIIPEFIGYLVETAVIALWKSRPLQAIRNWWAADPDRGDTILFIGFAIFWLGLFIHGIA